MYYSTQVPRLVVLVVVVVCSPGGAGDSPGEYREGATVGDLGAAKPLNVEAHPLGN